VILTEEASGLLVLRSVLRALLRCLGRSAGTSPGAPVICTGRLGLPDSQMSTTQYAAHRPGVGARRLRLQDLVWSREHQHSISSGLQLGVRDMSFSCSTANESLSKAFDVCPTEAAASLSHTPKRVALWHKYSAWKAACPCVCSGGIPFSKNDISRAAPLPPLIDSKGWRREQQQSHHE
jgi:hypothetical protein